MPVHAREMNSVLLPSISKLATFLFTSHFMLCVFLYPILAVTSWPNWCKQFVCSVVSKFFKHSIFNKLSDDIFYHWSLLCISIESLHAYFIWVFGHQLLLEPNIHCHATLHYECNYCKLCLYFSRELPDFLTKEVPHETFPI